MFEGVARRCADPSGAKASISRHSVHPSRLRGARLPLSRLARASESEPVLTASEYRLMATKARRLMDGVNDKATMTLLNAYADECGAKAAAADIEEAMAAKVAKKP